MPVAVGTVAVRSTDGSIIHLPPRQLDPIAIDRLRMVLPVGTREASRSISNNMTDMLVDSDPSMWVQRYAPRGFNELLTSNKSNIEVLRWINNWKTDNSDDDEVPKILLISGPAGVGKTTLAHAAAQQCNFNVIEINAS